MSQIFIRKNLPLAVLLASGLAASQCHGAIGRGYRYRAETRGVLAGHADSHQRV